MIDCDRATGGEFGERRTQHPNHFGKYGMDSSLPSHWLIEGHSKEQSEMNLPRCNFKNYGSVIEDCIFAQQRETEKRLEAIVASRERKQRK